VVNLLVILFATVVAYANPPPKDSEQWKEMEPYQKAIQDARNPNQGFVSCCSIADGRIVESRVKVDAKTGKSYYEVLFREPSYLENPPVGWQRVPDDSVLQRPPDSGILPIAWWVAGQVKCFYPGGGV
jgi:hypothetical protein